MKLSSVAVTGVDVRRDGLADSFGGFGDVEGYFPAVTLFLTLELNKIGINVPGLLFAPIEPINKIEHLSAHKRIITINIHNNIASSAVHPRG